MTPLISLEHAKFWFLCSDSPLPTEIGKQIRKTLHSTHQIVRTPSLLMKPSQKKHCDDFIKGMQVRLSGKIISAAITVINCYFQYALLCVELYPFLNLQHEVGQLPCRDKPTIWTSKTTPQDCAYATACTWFTHTYTTAKGFPFPLQKSLRK